MQPSNRKYPAILFNNQVREAGDQIIEVKGLGKTLNGEVMFKDISFDLKRRTESYRDLGEQSCHNSFL